MKTTLTVEYKNNKDEWDYMEVEFIGYPVWQNDSFDYAGTHCTGGVGGTCQLPDYATMEDEPEYDQSKYTLSENKIISKWLSENMESAKDTFCNMLRQETIPDY